MKLPLRILDTGISSARWNVAMTATLAEVHGTGAVGDMVRLHRYRPCVLIGAGQEARTAADLDYCRRAGIDIARRITGGGAVYMSATMLAWDVMVDRVACCGPLDEVARRVCGGVAAGLSRLGAAARFRPPNDIAIGGRKVSGSSGYAAGRSAVLQGTVLLADETIAMASALRLPEAELRECTTDLKSEIGMAPSFSSLIDALVAGLAEALRREPAAGPLRQDELALCECRLRDEVCDDAVGSVSAPA